jgi:hypothetical protein
MQEPNINQGNDSIGIKQFVKKVWGFLRYLMEIKWKLILCLFFGSILGLIYAIYIQKPIYTSNISFTLEQKNSSAGSLGGLASSLGLGDLASAGSGSGLFGGENILFLLKSNRIIHKSLKEPIPELNGDNLLNLYLEAHYKSQIEKKKVQKFPKSILNVDFTRTQDSLLLVITKNIRKYQLETERLDKKTTIINLNVEDLNEKWAYHFSKMLVKNSIELYLEIKIGKLLRTENDLIAKRDSIRGLLDGSITTLATETDLNMHTPLMRYKTKQAKKQVDVEVLKNMYASVIQNLELTRFQRTQEEPIIEIIDEPLFPLEVEKVGKIKAAIFFSFLFCILFILFDYLKMIISN